MQLVGEQAPNTTPIKGAAHIAMWTPLPPQRTGIADYSADLLDALTRRCEVEVVADDCSPLPALRERSRIYTQGEFEASGCNVGLHVYQMGNNFDFHDGIYQQALKQPGLLVLHDTTLFDFHYARLWLGQRQREFLDELEYGDGPAGIKGFLDNLLHKQITDLRQFAMTRRLIERSLAVIVHSKAAARTLQNAHPTTPIYQVYSGAHARHGTGRAIRARHHWREDDLVIGIFGGLHPLKRISTVLETFHRIYKQIPHVKIVIAGREDLPAYTRQIEEIICRADVQGSILRVGELPINEFRDYIQAVDMAINLRWPTAGETSATLMRVFAAGKLVITSDIEQNREFPAEFCWRIATDETLEREQLTQALLYAAAHLAEVRALGNAARTFVDQNATWDHAADRYREIIERTQAQLSDADTPTYTTLH